MCDQGVPVPVLVYSSDPSTYRRIWMPFALWGLSLMTFGGVIALWPEMTGRLFVTLFGALALFAGVTQLASAVFARQRLKGLAWLPVVTGILALIIGTVTLAALAFVARVFAFVIGTAAFAWGFSDIAIGWTGREYFPTWRLHIVRGLITASAGAFLMARPLEALIADALVVGLWAMAIGALTFVLGLMARGVSRDS